MPLYVNAEQFNAGLLDEEVQFDDEEVEQQRENVRETMTRLEEEQTGRSARLTENEDIFGADVPNPTLVSPEREYRRDREIQAEIRRLEAERRKLRVEQDVEEEKLGIDRVDPARVGKYAKGRKLPVRSRSRPRGQEDAPRGVDSEYDELERGALFREHGNAESEDRERQH